VEAASEPKAGEMLVDAHGMDPVKVLRLVQAMGGKIQRLLLVACEPSRNIEEMDMELSPAVRLAIPEAVRMVESLIAKMVQRRSTPSDFFNL
jgi:hydrogenase maturation protease